MTMRTIFVTLSISALCQGANLRSLSEVDDAVTTSIVGNLQFHGSQGGSALESMKQSMGNIWENYNPSQDTPYFWHIPMAGGEKVLPYFTVCMRLTETARLGTPATKEKLEFTNVDGYKYVNVDLSTKEGISHARRLELPASNMADIVSSAYVGDISTILFDQHHVGKMFAVFRHPIHRLVSKFYVMQKNALARHPELAEMTLEEYARQPKYVGENWMTRMLVGKPEGPLEASDLKMAKEIVKKKCLVGLITQLDESLDRFEKYFSWDERPTTMNKGKCQKAMLDLDAEGGMFNPDVHFIEADSEVWNLLLKVSQFDLELYLYAVQVFASQRKMFLPKE